MTRLWVRSVLSSAVAAALLSGCGGSASNKAGGSQSRPLVLTLADGEQDASNARPFADAVKRFSNGALVIKIESPWRPNDPSYETGLIKDVEAGKAQLGVVASRAFDTAGSDSFEALQAPFLVDSVALEQKILASKIPQEMLQGLGQAGLVGLVVLPGPLRRPVGLGRQLRSAADFRGARIGIRPSGVTAAVLRTLGAIPVVLPRDNDAAGLSGLEGHVTNLDMAFAERDAVMTGNLDLEPRPNVIFMGRRAFESVSSADRAILVRAAGQARISGGIYEPDGESAQDLCRRGIKIVAASSSDVAGLRAAVQPVYRTLESSPRTKAFVEEITSIRKAAGGSPDTASCPMTPGAGGIAVSAKELLGRWDVTYTLSQLNGAGADSSEDIPTNYGHQILTFAGRHFSSVGPHVGPSSGPASGTYVVKGDEVTFYRSDHSYPGSDTEIWGPYTWSVYRDTLTFKKNGPGPMPTSLAVKAWRRSANGG
jgi:TRAP-type C4-dicarboxylate transport system substrate-binding protein